MSFLLSGFPWPTFFLTLPVICISIALYLSSLSPFHLVGMTLSSRMFVAWELLEGRYHILFILLSWCGRLKMAINYFPFEKWSVFALTLNHGWPCHLLWSVECGGWHAALSCCVKSRYPPRETMWRESWLPGHPPALPAIPAEMSKLVSKPIFNF